MALFKWIGGWFGGATPGTLTRPLPQPFPGSAARGARLAAGALATPGETIALPPEGWSATGEASDTLHGFGWLDDMVAADPDRARDLISSWLGAPRDAGADAPATTGRRICAWLSHAQLWNEDPILMPVVMRELSRAAKALLDGSERAPPGLPRIEAIAGLIYAWAGGLLPAKALNAARHRLTAEIQAQVVRDGVHASRDPAQHAAAFAWFARMQAALAATHEAAPALDTAVSAMAPMTRFFRHGDGGLALFNGATEGDVEAIEAALALAGIDGPPPNSAPVAGFERVANGDSVLLLDCGAPAAPPFEATAHAAPLAIEVSLAGERVIVNCGGGGGDAEWRRAQRATAAHSTAVVDDTNAAELTDGGLGRKPAAVTVEREDADGATWIAAAHDGYAQNFGLTHRRRLYISPDGRDVRGEDGFEGAHDGTFAVRFHLHPDLRVEASANGAVLTLASGAKARFQAAGGPVAIEPSIYLGRAPMRRAQQIVVTGRTPGTTIKWALKLGV